MKVVVLLVLYVFINAQNKPDLAQKEYAMPLGATKDDCEEFVAPKALTLLFAKNKIIAFDHQCVEFNLQPLQSASAK